MIHRARMFWSLICLVMAMTGTSALLSWVKPASNPTTAAISVDRIRGLAHAVVAEAQLVRQEQWHSVEVLAGPPHVGRGRLLAAATSQPDCHFRVDLDGRPSSTMAWISQRETPDLPSVIAIQVVRQAGSQPMTPMQWECVRCLVTELSQRLGSERALLPVRLPSEWGEVYTVAGGTTLQLTPPPNI